MISEGFLEVLRCSLKFWDVLRPFKMLSWSLSCSVRFLKVQKRSKTFWCDVRCSRGFWKILEGSKVFYDVLVVLGLSLMLSCVVSSCERFMYILRYPLTCYWWSNKFWGVHMGLSDSERLLKVQRRFLTFWNVLRCYCGFWVVLKGCWKFWGIPWYSGMFWDILRCCEVFSSLWAVLKISWRFWVVLWLSGVLRCS